MKKARTIAELHYPNKAGNRFDEKYRQSRINALEKLIAEQLTLTDVVSSFLDKESESLGINTYT
jgi:hypothetical protein